MKKLLIGLGAALVVVTLVWGVLAANGDASPTPTPPSSPAPSPAATPGGSAGAVYYLSFKPEQARAWEDVARRYTQLTGVPVTIVTAASGSYEDTLRSEIEKNEPPTLFQVNGPVGLRSWRDFCYDLRDTALYQNLNGDEFALIEDGRVLGVAYAIETYGLIYNRALLQRAGYSPDDITDFASLKKVAEDIQSRKDELGVLGAFTSAGMDASSDWRFKTHLANLPLYYEYKARGISDTDAMQGDYLNNFKQVWDLYLNNATCAPALIGARTGEDAASEFALGEAVFYQNGVWAYQDCVAEGLNDGDLGMLPIYIGVEGEENQGLCTGSENYWCVNRRAKPEDIEATLAFAEWLITSDEGREAMTAMGYTTPFTTFDNSQPAANALAQSARDDLSSGHEPVGWAFVTMPSETWKNQLGAAMLAYAQGDADWSAVEAAYVDGWAREAAAGR